MILLIGLINLSCAFLSYGATFAHFEREFPGRGGHTVIAGLMFKLGLLCGPLVLLMVMFESNFFRAGFRWRQ